MISQLHLITDDRILAGTDFVATARAVLSAGTGRATLHLRGPATSGRRLWELGSELRPFANGVSVPLVVNDRVDLALILPADGAQLGARSLPASKARRILGPGALLGCSLHGREEAEALLGEDGLAAGSPDFALVGTLFRSRSHPNGSPGGVALISRVTPVLPSLPLIGIGGVTAERAPDVLAAGAHGVAVIRAVWDASDPAAAVEGLLQAIGSAGSSNFDGSES